MKNIFKFRTAVVLLTIACFTSCQKTDLEAPAKPSGSEFDRAEYNKNIVDESISGSYSIKNGVMHFRDLKSFDETVAKFKAFSDAQKSLFINDAGFSSYSNEFAKILAKLDNAKDKAEYDKIVSQNQNILEIDWDGVPRPKIGDQLMNDFINREGLVYIGKVLYMFGKTEQRIAFDGEVSTLKNEGESKQLMILKFRTSVKNARACFDFYGQRTQTGDRRATVTTGVATQILYSGSTYIVRYNLRVQGYPEKKNFWGNFVNYNTDNHLTGDFTFGVGSLNPGGQGNSMAVTDDVSNSDQNRITIDRFLDFGNVFSPSAFINEHYHFLDDSPPGQLPGGGSSPNNTYGTIGVSPFQYTCRP